VLYVLSDTDSRPIWGNYLPVCRQRRSEHTPGSKRQREHVVKRAIVKQRRELADGRRLVNVVCPVCDHRHWMAKADTGCCPRKPGRFAIAGGGAKCPTLTSS
jgi:hypothetical protein